MIKHMTTLTMCPIAQGAPSLSSVLTTILICPHYDHVPNCPCAPSPKVPPSLSLILHMIPLCPMCPIAHVSLLHISKKMSSCHKDVKLSERCQNVKKMSSCQKDVKCQKVKHIDYGGSFTKKNKFT